MAVEFFNFTNDETFHFFKWVSEGGKCKPIDMIAKAFEKAEDSDEHFPDEAICIVVRDKLADLLSDVLAEEVPDADPSIAPGIGDVGDTAESLWLPILSLALSQIDCLTVAEALLIQAGKWAPDRELPEIL